MRLSSLTVCNYRSIKRCEQIRIEPLQALVGENNAGKSNILRAVQVFLTAGAAGVQAADFNDVEQPIVIEAEFSALSDQDRKRLRPYLIEGRLVLRKELRLKQDEKTGKQKVDTEYHGYQAEPQDWWLSLEKIEEQEGGRPNYKQIAEDHGILSFVATDDGKVTKSSYRDGLSKYLRENDVEYDEPVLGQTQALGLQANLLSALPEFYLFPAIVDFSDEIDRRSSTSVFRRLMGDLASRIMKLDSRYAEVEEARTKLEQLLNPSDSSTATKRLGALEELETALASSITQVMPSVKGVRLAVEVEDSKELFARGVALRVDDGVLTDVLDKGNGLQRSVVFGMLQLLIKNVRNRDGDITGGRPIILGIEEPELYIHPQSQRLIYRVLKEFVASAASASDQVIYTTHSPAFVDVGSYEQIGIVCKTDPEEGSIVRQCAVGELGSSEDRKGFKLLTSFGLKQNELFFARRVVLVEGIEDEIAIIAGARKLNFIRDLPDEAGVAIVSTHGKQELPKFQRILNAFGVRYSVLLELDGKDETDAANAAILSLMNGNAIAKVPTRIEDCLGRANHFSDVYDAKSFCSNPANITNDFQQVVRVLLE